jgi:hypothetical protein
LNPQNQVSRRSLVVPVLPARSVRFNCSARVAVPRRMTSLIMSVIRKSFWGEITDGASHCSWR